MQLRGEGKMGILFFRASGGIQKETLEEVQSAEPGWTKIERRQWSGLVPMSQHQ